MDIVICGHRVTFDDNIYNIYEGKKYNGNEVIDVMLNMKVQGVLWGKLFKIKLLREKGFSFKVGRYIQDWLPVSVIYYTPRH
ncbi:hypothetical protein KSU66_02210 [Sporosarcina sp. G11-34]|nr:hypothetical protein [Sporosarcina sp. G11-34]